MFKGAKIVKQTGKSVLFAMVSDQMFMSCRDQVTHLFEHTVYSLSQEKL
jgi:hypothetical protein